MMKRRNPRARRSSTSRPPVIPESRMKNYPFLFAQDEFMDALDMVLGDLGYEAIRTLAPDASKLPMEGHGGDPDLLIAMNAGNPSIRGLIVQARFARAQAPDQGVDGIVVEFSDPVLADQAVATSSMPTSAATLEEVVDTMVKSAFGPGGATFIMTDTTGREVAGMVMTLRISVDADNGYALTPMVSRLGDRRLGAILATERIRSAINAMKDRADIQARIRSCTSIPADYEGLSVADGLIALCEPWSSRLKEALAGDGRGLEGATPDWVHARIKEWVPSDEA